MPQNYTRTLPNAPRLQTALGFVPRRQPTSGSGATVDEASGEVSVDTLPTVTTFGTGAPVADGVLDGDLYFDDTLAVYVGYVWRGAAWNQF